MNTRGQGVGLEETLKPVQFHPCSGQGHLHWTRLLQALSSLAWGVTECPLAEVPLSVPRVPS